MLSSKELSRGPKSLSSPLAISNDETAVNVSVDTYTPNANDQVRNIHSLTGGPIEGPINQRLTYAAGSQESKGRNGVSSAGSADGDKRPDPYPYTGTGRPSLNVEEASARLKTSSSSRRDTYRNLPGETASSTPGPSRLGAFGVSVQDVPRHVANPVISTRTKSLLDESSLKMTLPGSDLGAFSTVDRPSTTEVPSTSPSTFGRLQSANSPPGRYSLLPTRRLSLDQHGHVPQQFWSAKQKDADSDIIQREVSAKRKSGSCVGAVSAFFGRRIESSGVTTGDSPSAARLRLAPIQSPKVCPQTSPAVAHLASPPRSGPKSPSVGTILGSEPASKRQRTNSRGNRNRRPSLGSRPSPPFSWFTPASLPDRPSFAGWSSGRIRAYRMGWEDAMRAIEMGVFGYGDQQYYNPTQVPNVTSSSKNPWPNSESQQEAVPPSDINTPQSAPHHSTNAPSPVIYSSEEPTQPHHHENFSHGPRPAGSPRPQPVSSTAYSPNTPHSQAGYNYATSSSSSGYGYQPRPPQYANPGPTYAPEGMIIEHRGPPPPNQYPYIPQQYRYYHPQAGFDHTSPLTSPTSSQSQHREETRTGRSQPRQPISCYPCRVRKLKCDGGHPCSQCLKRSSTDSCAYADSVRRRGKAKRVATDGNVTADGEGKGEASSDDDKEQSPRPSPSGQQNALTTGTTIPPGSTNRWQSPSSGNVIPKIEDEGFAAPNASRGREFSNWRSGGRPSGR